MNFESVIKYIFSLFLSILFLGLFYFQFLTLYSFIIDYFIHDKLFTLYAHLFIYIFLVHLLFVSLVNFANHYFIQSKVFILINVVTLLIFYLFIGSKLGYILKYFLYYFTSQETILGMILFMVTIIGYSFYSLFVLLFDKGMPLLHMLLFLLIGLFYSIKFIDSYCYDVWERVHLFLG